MSHALGDAGSPYLIGQIADWIKKDMTNAKNGTMDTTTLSSMAALANNSTTAEDPYIEFQSLQYSLFTTVAVQILGGIFFLVTAWYIVDDKKDCDGIITQASGESIDESSQSSSNSNTVPSRTKSITDLSEGTTVDTSEESSIATVK